MEANIKYNRDRRQKYHTDEEYRKKERQKAIGNYYKDKPYTYDDKQQMKNTPKLYDNKSKESFVIRIYNNAKDTALKSFRYKKIGKEKAFKNVLSFINENYNEKYIDKRK